uniref:Uncharacterized protein n=1 Tax=Kalanchoe fedtschenkoi TaxID=63787 RepID=A0A7N0TIF8_KALFE
MPQLRGIPQPTPCLLSILERKPGGCGKHLSELALGFVSPFPWPMTQETNMQVKKLSELVPWVVTPFLIPLVSYSRKAVGAYLATFRPIASSFELPYLSRRKLTSISSNPRHRSPKLQTGQQSDRNSFHKPVQEGKLTIYTLVRTSPFTLSKGLGRSTPSKEKEKALPPPHITVLSG